MSAVVVRWRGGDETRRCLSSLTSADGCRPAQVVLVDSGSGDGGADRLAAEFPTVTTLALESNRGFAAAANAGALRCETPSILLLNPDTEVASPALEKLELALEAHPEAAGVVPMLCGADGRPQWRWQLRRLPTVLDLSLGRGGRPACRSVPTRPSTIAQPAAAAWLVRRRVWQQLGGFDEGFVPAWWEDVDFCARLNSRLGTPGFGARRGFLVIPDAHLHHIGASSVAALGRNAFLLAYYGNLLRFASLHHAARIRHIRRTLCLSLWLRSVANPRSRAGYRAVLDSIKKSPV